MPKVHDPEAIWEQLIPLISNGLSLPAALKKLPSPRPSLWWVKMSVRKSPEIAAKYQDAQELRAEALVDQLIAAAETKIPPGIKGADAAAWVNNKRLFCDCLKWTSSKLFPRRFGDSVQLAVDVSQRISITDALRQAEQRVINLREEPVQLIEMDHQPTRTG